ncbi:zinc-ribbon and FHA domain-containing protein [Tessaracoccus sp. OS52]|uniref:FHA domain-containing protein n=1 Tax=Tessaracoccus sp. OS52 TaxID=2886691 RepID=UPI001D12CE1A|nr:FHA domain-containing protein [Tessaracoccus sp. OS52]MCC2592863.1 zinc-ribbon and FHA domain-containing protein [Tessaracoccus sp. OS52]
MKCRQCGNVSQAGAKFCSNCGAPLYDSMGDTTTVLGAITDDHDGELTADDLEAVRGLSGGDALLIINRGGSGSSRILIDSDVTTVGRHPQSDVFLDDITVSRHHAKFIRTGGDLFIEDLGSLNGTYVNRKLVEERTQLKQGDEIQIGKYRATISLSEPGLR